MQVAMFESLLYGTLKNMRRPIGPIPTDILWRIFHILIVTDF